MATISVSLPSDGQTIDASDYNTPINTIVNEFNGNIDNANIKAGAAIATSKLASDAGIINAMIADDTITGAKIDFADTGAGAIWWEEIGRTTLGSAGDVITVSGLPARKYLKVIVTTLDTGGAINMVMTLNNSTTANTYPWREVIDAVVSSNTTAQGITLNAASAAVPQTAEILIHNYATDEKTILATSIAAGTAGATAPNLKNLAGKWTNTTDQITRIDITNSAAGSYNTGSEVVVLGHN